MPITITPELPVTHDAILLIGELENYIAPLYPHDSEHGLSPEELVRKGVAFFVIRSDGILAGCGGVRLYGIDYGEIMRMYVRPEFRGKGFGKLILQHLEEYALDHGIRVLRLKTGIFQPEALGLYEQQGYRIILPFGAYKAHRLNKYYEKNLP